MKKIFAIAESYLHNQKYEKAIRTYLSTCEIDGQIELNPNDKNYRILATSIINVYDKMCVGDFNSYLYKPPKRKHYLSPQAQNLIGHFYIHADISWGTFHNIQQVVFLEQIISFFNYVFSKQGINENLLKNTKIINLIHKNDDYEFNITQKNLDEVMHETISNDIIFNKEINAILGSPLVIGPLNRSFIGNNTIEQFLVAIRRFLLEKSEKNYIVIDNNIILLNLLRSISSYCFRNEYCWFETKDESKAISTLIETIKKKINNYEEVNITLILILSCYRMLYDIPPLKEYLIKNHKKYSQDQQIIKVHIEDIKKEKELEKTIKRRTKIKNKISKKVKNQYEQYPYPRWSGGYNKINNYTYMESIKFDFPNIKEINIKNILIAGSGTGQHPINIAKFSGDTVIDAIDLSRKSLSYGKRKAEEFSIDNINWFEADLLELEDLKDEYDLIESSGVLHHIEDPKKGFDILSKKLKSNGIMKISLYARSFRDILKPTKEFLNERKFTTDINSIRLARKEIMESDQQDLYHRNVDFYSSSTFIDLFMHEQELDFNIQEFEEIFEDDFTFIGFQFPNSTKHFVLTEYKKAFGSNSSLTDLSNWARLEKENFKIFSSMYSAYLQKKT